MMVMMIVSGNSPFSLQTLEQKGDGINKQNSFNENSNLSFIQ